MINKSLMLQHFLSKTMAFPDKKWEINKSTTRQNLKAQILDLFFFISSVQARGLLGQNTGPDGVNFALEGSGGKNNFAGNPLQLL